MHFLSNSIASKWSKYKQSKKEEIWQGAEKDRDQNIDRHCLIKELQGILLMLVLLQNW